MSWLSFFTEYLGWTLAVLALVLVFGLLALRRQLSRARTTAGSTPSADELPAANEGVTYLDLRAEGGPFNASFDRALKLLRQASPGGDLYATPWYLVVGETAAGKTTLLSRLGLPLPFGAPVGASSPAARPEVNAWIFEPGVALDSLGALVLRSDGLSSDEAGWLDLLGGVRRARPRRPIDGLVVVIPAYELLSGASVDARQTAAAGRAGRIYSKLLQAQLILGMQLPIDVVISQADGISGFTDFTERLPARFRQQLFGWSNPHPLDAPYQTTWVDEAYGSILGRLEQIIGALPGGSSGASPGSAGAAGFPAYFAETQPAMQVYLNHLFAAAGLGESCTFRGLYVCGGRFEPCADGSACATEPREILFARDVFADRVFPESAIGQPTRAATSSRNRNRRRLQLLTGATALLGGAALLWGYRAVSADADALAPAIDRLGTVRAGADQSWVRAVLGDTATVRHYEPRSLALPASWFSPLHGDIRAVFELGYQQGVFPVSVSALGERLKGLERRELPPIPARAPTELLGVDETPEFRRLQGYVGDITALESATEDYSCISETCVRREQLAERFNGMARYLYASQLALPNRESALFYGGVFDRLALDPWVYAQEDATILGARTRQLDTDLDRTLFRENALVESLERLVEDLDELETPYGASASVSVETYQRLDAELRLVAWLLQQPQLAWMGSEPLDLGAGMEAVYTAIGASHYLGEELEKELRARAEAAFKALRLRLRTFETQATGPVLARRDGQVILALSPGTLEVQRSVENYLDQVFIEAGALATLQLPTDLQRLQWSQDLVQQSLDLVAPYDAWVAKELPTFPPDMRSTAEQVALQSLSDSMLDLLAQAEIFEVAPSAARLAVPPQLLESNLATRAANFQAVRSPLAQILSSFSRLGFVQAYAELAAVLERQEQQLLADTTALLVQFDLYSPRGDSFAGWDGLAPPAPEAFDATDAKRLASYLSSQRAIVSRLAQSYAEPVVQAASEDEGLWRRSRALQTELDRWSTILTDLEQAKSEKAGNPVTDLESFISSDLSTVTLRTCYTEPTGPAVTSDYFDGRRASLEDELRSQCTVLAQGYGYACYREMAARFNDRLANRFPFSERLPMPNEAEADPASLRDFFGLYDETAWLYREVPPSAALYGTEQEPVARFLVQSGEVRAFLAPFLDDPKKVPVPSFGFSALFRTETASERGAEDVIDWTLATAGASHARGDATASGVWSLGSLPSSVALRWAANAPVAPVEAISGDVVRIDGRTVIWDYSNTWSLVALMIDHRVARTAGSPPPETLLFSVQTAPSPPPSPSVAGLGWQQADLYLRLLLTTPDGKAPLFLPSAFPSTAPLVPIRPTMRTCPSFPAAAAAAAPAAPAASASASATGANP